MARLDQAVKDFKDLLKKRNIHLRGKLTIYFGDFYECDIIYEPFVNEIPLCSIDAAALSPHHKSVGHSGNEWKNPQSKQIVNYEGHFSENDDIEECDIHTNISKAFANSQLQAEETPSQLFRDSGDASLPSFENILNSKISTRSSDVQSVGDKWDDEGCPPLSQFLNEHFDGIKSLQSTCDTEEKRKHERNGMTSIKTNDDVNDTNNFCDHEIDTANTNQVQILANPMLSANPMLPANPIFLPRHSLTTEVSLLALLRNDNGYGILTPALKRSVQHYLNILRKEDLIDIVFQALKDRKNASPDDTSCEVSTNSILETAITDDEKREAQKSENHQTEMTKLEQAFPKEDGTSLADGSHWDVKTTANAKENPKQRENLHEVRKDKFSTSVCLVKTQRKRKRNSSSQSVIPEQNATPLRKRHCLRSSLKVEDSQATPGTVGSSNNFETGVNAKELNGKQCNKERESRLKCQTCHVTFLSRRMYRRHLQTHVYSYKCDICHKVLKSKDSLYHHQRGLHSKEKPYHCHVCDAPFSFHHSYKLHLQKHKGERPFTCKLCPKSYLTSNHLKEHVQAVHSSNCIVCHICGKTFSYNSALKVHLLSHSDEKLYCCSICGKKFNSQHSLTCHAACHTQKQSFQCEMCGKHFKSSYARNVHSKCHNKTQVKRFSCEICGKSFSYKYILDNHIEAHNKFQSFACNICGKSFKSKASLYTHKYVHNEGLAFQCSICSKSFKTKNCLLAHTKRHQNHHTFACSICGRKFPDKGGLSKHTKTVHSPQKYFSCKICGKTGTRGDNMRTHVKSHRNEVSISAKAMDFIICVEKPNPSILGDQSSDAFKDVNKESNQNMYKIYGENVQKSSENQNGADNIFFQQDACEKALLSVDTPLEFTQQKGSCSAISGNSNHMNEVSDSRKYIQTVPSSLDEKISIVNSIPYPYTQEIEMDNVISICPSAATTTTSIVSSLVLQSHLATASVSSQFLPEYDYFRSVETVILPVPDHGMPKGVETIQMDSTNGEWLMPSAAQPVTSLGHGNVQIEELTTNSEESC